jgi:GNAT superfamily N-acetyltransferase
MKTTRQTPAGEITFQQAQSPSDEGTVLHIMRDAAQWLEREGIPQWKGMLTPKGPDLVQQRVKAGVAYLAFLHGRAVGTVAILWDDAFSWAEKGTDGSAGYIHGLAVLREYAGKGIGREILRWAVGEIKARKPFVRLDCMAENPDLCRYYEEEGFIAQGQRVLSTGFKVRLYEKKSAL